VMGKKGLRRHLGLLPCQWFLVGIGIGLGARKTAIRKKADFRVTSQEYMGEAYRDRYLEQQQTEKIEN
jgi:hypothetical protein